MTQNKVLSQGQKFNRLTFVEHSGLNKHGAKTAVFKCDCGNEKIFILNNVINGRTTSCGCFRKEYVSKERPGFKHGLAKTPIYDTWQSMMKRCYKTSNKNYHQYGGRGIRVCDEWHDPRVFQTWAVANGYGNGLQLDRINTNGNYEPSNCRFVTSKENNNNRRDNHVIDFRGQSKTLQQWADEIGVETATLRARLGRLNWTIEKALTTPPKW